MARKFQGYARDRGFRRQDPGYGYLQRMREQSEGVVRNMEDQARSRQQEAQRQNQALDNNFRLGQRIKDDIKQFDDKVADFADSNREKRNRQAIKNIETTAANSAKLYSDLEQFSKTLLAVGGEIKKDQEKYRSSKRLSEAMIATRQQVADPQADKEFQQQEDTLFTNSSQLNSAVAKSGAPPVVQEVNRAQDASLAYLTREQRIIKATEEFNQLPFGTDLDQAAIDIGLKYELDTVNYRKLKPFVDAFDTLKAAHQNTENRLRTQKEADKSQSELLGSLRDSPPTGPKNQYLIDSLAALHIDGTKPLGYKEAWEVIHRQQSELAYSEKQFQDFWSQVIPEGLGAGKTYKEFHESKYLRTQAKRRENFEADVKKQGQLLEAASKKEFLEAKQALMNSGTITDYRAYQTAIQNDTTLLPEQKKQLMELAYARSVTRNNSDKAIALARENAAAGRDIGDLRLLIGAEHLPEYEELEAARKTAREAAGVPTLKESAKTTAKLTEETIVAQAALTSKTFSENAKRVVSQYHNDKYETYYEEKYSRTRDHSAAHLYAQDQIVKDLTTGTGRLALKEVRGRIDFPNYNKPEYVGSINDAQLMRSIKDDPSIISSSPIMLRDSAFDIANAYISDTVPPANRVYDSLTYEQKQAVMDFNSENFGTPKVTVPKSPKDVAVERANDPRLQMFLQILNNPVDLYKLPAYAEHRSYVKPAIAEQIAMTPIEPAEGGLTGLTAQDYKELAFIVSAEAQRDSPDEFAVAASVLNRLATGRFGSSISEIARRPGQYEAVTLGTAKYEPALAARLASPEGQRMIVAALRKLEGRTDYKGQSQIGNREESDPMFSPAGNFFHYQGQRKGSGPYTGPIDRSYERFIN